MTKILCKGYKNSLTGLHVHMETEHYKGYIVESLIQNKEYKAYDVIVESKLHKGLVTQLGFSSPLGHASKFLQAKMEGIL